MIIGAGPAGLTAAYELLRRDRPVRVFEADDVIGGISRTVERDGWRFDIGGHRFFTKVPRVEEFWHEILPDEDFLLRPRMSRIYYRGGLYDYPLRAVNALRNLGVLEAARCIGSYARARLRPPKDQSHFEGWVSARFGWRLYSIFFKTYTEKVWGMPADQMQADWAAQRIKNLSLAKAVLNALLPRRNSTDVTSLIEEFQYPKLGPGMMWERCTDRVRDLGGEVTLRHRVSRVHRDPQRRRATAVTVDDGSGRPPGAGRPRRLLHADLGAGPGDGPAGAGAGPRRRRRPALPRLPHRGPGGAGGVLLPGQLDLRARPRGTGGADPELRLLVAVPGQGGADLPGAGVLRLRERRACGTATDADLVALATAELEQLGLVRPGCVESGHVVRMPKAYPVYDERYQHNVDVIRDWLAAEVPNVHPVGRNGMHRYNNQDHSMLTAMLVAENIADGAEHDVWSVNVEQDYHEQSSAADGSGQRGTGRDAPVVPAAGRG